MFFFRSSFELRGGVAVSLEGSVDDICAGVDHVWHDWLVHASIPRNVSWLSHSVSVGGSVVLVIDRVLSGSPLSVSIRDRRVLRKNLSDGPEEQIWVVNQGLSVEGMVVKNNRSVVDKTTAQASDNEEDAPCISKPASDVEVFNGELSNHKKTQ